MDITTPIAKDESKSAFSLHPNRSAHAVGVGRVGLTEGCSEKAPTPEGAGEAHAQPWVRGLTTERGEEINERTLHQWQSVFQAAQPLATWLRLVKGAE